MEAATARRLRLREQHVVAAHRRHRAGRRQPDAGRSACTSSRPSRRCRCSRSSSRPQTDAWATATAVSLRPAHRQARDRGPRRARLLHERALAPYMNEAARLVEEGAAIEDVDRAMVDVRLPGGADRPARRGRDRRRAPRSPRSCITPSASAWPRRRRWRAVMEDGRLGAQEQARLLRLRRQEEGASTRRVYAPAASGAARASPFDAARHPGPPRVRVPERGRPAACRTASCARRATATWAPSSASASRPSWAGPSATSTTWARASRPRCWSAWRRDHGDRFRPASLLVDHARESGAPFHDEVAREPLHRQRRPPVPLPARDRLGPLRAARGRRASASRTARARWRRRASSTTRACSEVGRVRGARDRARAREIDEQGVSLRATARSCSPPALLRQHRRAAPAGHAWR